jgi:hypothetical protein
MLWLVGVGVADDDERLFGLGQHGEFRRAYQHPTACPQVKADFLLPLGEGGRIERPEAAAFPASD